MSSASQCSGKYLCCKEQFKAYRMFTSSKATDIKYALEKIIEEMKNKSDLKKELQHLLDSVDYLVGYVEADPR